MSSTLPIDIPYTKAADWLVERRVVGSSWQKTLRTAHAKLEAALDAERPPVEGASAILPAGRTRQATTYFECSAVLQLLKGSAGYDEKTFLGSYTNEHTARWADVVKRYESGSVFLIDTAQFLVHSCAYELPALKQEITRSEKELAELQRRQSEYTRLADASHARFVAACAKRRIPSTEEDAEGLRVQLEASRAQLKPLFERVARRLQTAPIPAALLEYRSFLTYALDKVEAAPPPSTDKPAAAGKGKAGKKGKGGADEVGAEPAAVAALSQDDGGEVAPPLPMLARVQELDLASLADAPPSTSEGGAEAAAATGSIEIDWGGSDNGQAAAAEPAPQVDWGIEVEEGDGDGGGDTAGSGAEIEIDWGMLGGGGGGGGGDGGSAANFDFEIEVEESGEGGGTAEDLSLISIFEQPTTRTQLLDDLFELQAFLAQYAADLAGGASVSTLPSGLQLDRAEAGARLAAVNEAIEALDDEHARHLLLLGASPRYLNRQVASLRQMLDSSAKMRARAEEMQTRQAELSLTIQGAFPRYEGVVGAIKKAKDEFEAALSKHFDGRRINLMGDINNL